MPEMPLKSVWMVALDKLMQRCNAFIKTKQPHGCDSTSFQAFNLKSHSINNNHRRNKIQLQSNVLDTLPAMFL